MPDTDENIRTKECPICGDSMRVKARERIDRIPGSGQTVKHVVKQWECPECSYEEDYEEDE
jgi:YgiT-type zinc finger domain-containing protein